MLNFLRASVRLVSRAIPKYNFNSCFSINNGNSRSLIERVSLIDLKPQCCKYGTLSQHNVFRRPLLAAVNSFTPQPSRNIIKFSLKKGKRKTCKAVIRRFYRLDWGIWIRTKCGRAKKMYKKSFNRKRRIRQHVFTNATQSWLLDKMVTKYWRRPRFYVDDPYEPYHSREEFPLTRRKPYSPLKY